MLSLQPETSEPRVSDDETLLTAGQMRQRYRGVSRMWLDRRLAADPTFPKPVYIGGRRYWRVGELRRWEATLSRKIPAAAHPVETSSALDGGSATTNPFDGSRQSTAALSGGGR
jgi:predicted DNA-binding transcriptional regulator AlpA